MDIHIVIEKIEKRLKEENIDIDFTKLITIQEMYMYEEFGVDIVERVVELCRAEQLAQEKLISKIANAKANDNDILEKEDIKEILHFRDDATALRFLRVCVKHGYGMKIGKSYKITRKNFEKMLKFLEGQEYDF